MSKYYIVNVIERYQIYFVLTKFQLQ